MGNIETFDDLFSALKKFMNNEFAEQQAANEIIINRLSDIEELIIRQQQVVADQQRILEALGVPKSPPAPSIEDSFNQ